MMAEEVTAFRPEAAGDVEGARAHYEEALAARREAFGSQHEETLVSTMNLAQLLLKTGAQTHSHAACAGIPQYVQESLAAQAHAYAHAFHPRSSDAGSEDAESLLQELVKGASEANGEESEMARNALGDLAGVLMRRGAHVAGSSGRNSGGASQWSLYTALFLIDASVFFGR